MWMKLFLVVALLCELVHSVTFEARSDCKDKIPICVADSDALRFVTGNGVGSLETDIYVHEPQDIKRNTWTECTAAPADSREINSAWFYFRIAKSGHLSFTLKPLSVEANDFDFLIWGPFADRADILDRNDGLNGKSCGVALTKEMHADCGYRRGPALTDPEERDFSGVRPASKLKDVTEGEWYVMMVNSVTPNVEFRLQSTPEKIPAGRVHAETDCGLQGLRGPAYYEVKSKFHPANGGVLLGEDAAITFTGWMLDTRANGDTAKTILTRDPLGNEMFCNDETRNRGAAFEMTNFPTESFREIKALWNTIFLLPGDFKVCYRNRGLGDGGTDIWEEVPRRASNKNTILVTDARSVPPRLPIAPRDAKSTNTKEWTRFHPTTFVVNEEADLQIQGLEAYNYDDVWVKIVVDDCLESKPTTEGGEPRLLDDCHRAKFRIPIKGRYRVCAKYREDWEEMRSGFDLDNDYLLVSIPNNAVLYDDYFSCGQFLNATETKENKKACGCFINARGTVDQEEKYPFVNMPLDYPAKLLKDAEKLREVRQGCCIHGAERKVQAAQNPAVNYSWGWCSDEEAEEKSADHDDGDADDADDNISLVE